MIRRRSGGRLAPSRIILEADGASRIALLGGFVQNPMRAFQPAHVTVAGPTLGAGLFAPALR